MTITYLNFLNTKTNKLCKENFLHSHDNIQIMIAHIGSFMKYNNQRLISLFEVDYVDPCSLDLTEFYVGCQGLANSPPLLRLGIDHKDSKVL